MKYLRRHLLKNKGDNKWSLQPVMKETESSITCLHGSGYQTNVTPEVLKIVQIQMQLNKDRSLVVTEDLSPSYAVSFNYMLLRVHIL